LSKERRKSIIVPLYKKEEPRQIHKYRDTNSWNAAYKKYVAISNKRIVNDLEDSKILDETQTSFKKNCDGIDKMYALGI
jgi:uncharacterized protein YlbG (UPF0298 family)